MTMRNFQPIAAALLLLACAACSKSDAGKDSASTKPPALEVGVATPVQREFPILIEAFGTFAGDSRRVQTLTLPQAGQVVAIAATPGRRVAKGESLLQLATDPTTRNTYQQAQSTLQIAKDDLDRTTRLHAEHLATNAQLDTARKALADSKSALAAQALLGGAHAQVDLRAPADGVVTQVAVTPGERVQAGAKLIEFTPLHALSAQLGVVPEDAASIRPDMPVAITPVYAAAAKPLQGRVTIVSGALNPQSHLIDVLAEVAAGDDRALAAGAALRAEIEVGRHNAWAVPRAALLGDEKGHYVFQIEHETAHRVDVDVLSPAGDPIGVTGTLDGNAPVITTGAYELADGDAVRAQAAAGPAP